MKMLINSKKMKKITMMAAPLALSAFVVFPYGSASAHCDSIDGPVVMAAKKALETGNVNYALPYVYKGGEEEVKAAFQKTMETRKDKQAQEVIDHWFYETVVRVHRDGEGASYTGLKPAGIDYGPALPAAEEALEKGSAEHVKHMIMETIEAEIDKRFAEVMEKPTSVDHVDEARERAEGELLFQKYIHQLYTDATTKAGHGEGGHEQGNVDTQSSEAVHEHEQPALSGVKGPTIFLDGKKLDTDTSVIIENGQFFIPMRKVFEAAGAHVEWNQHERTVLAKVGNDTIKIKIGDKTVWHNGKKAAIEGKPLNKDGHTLVPLEFAEHVLGLEAVLDHEHELINLNRH